MSDNKPMSIKKTLPILVIAVLAVGGGSFYGGMLYGKSQAIESLAAQRGGANAFFADGQRGQNGFRPTGQSGTGGFVGSRNGGGLVNGEIISVDDQSVTVKLRDGGSKIVLLSEKTEISEFVSGELGDLAVGKNVMVMGTVNSDGSVTAQTVQLRPVPPAPPAAE